MSEVTPEILDELERTAVELVRLAGTEIVGALGRVLAVRYKRENAGMTAPTDPVSDVDQGVEVLIRAKVGERFPDHGIIGEEIDEPGGESAFTWVVDPIDGTLNFINGFPIFSAAVGVLHEGRPVAGAIWSSLSHALRPGVYHAREGGPLRFDDDQLANRANPAVRRHLVGEPGSAVSTAGPWDLRVTGSAAVECALVAIGLLRAARFASPNIWDVGAGFVLIRSAGCEIWHQPEAGRWAPFDRFMPVADQGADLRGWRGPIVIGEGQAAAALCRANA